MKKLGVFVLALLLSACGANYTSNGEQQYLHSHNGPNLVVPPPRVGVNISHFYDLPPQNQDARVSIEPRG